MPHALDDMLRARGALAPGVPGLHWGWTAAWVAAGSALYGGVMGAYGLRPLQMGYSACKVPLLIATSALLCLPPLVALNTALGLRGALASVLRAAALAQGTVAVCLAALAPLTIVAYLSLDEYGQAVLFNGACFLVAAVAGQVTLSRHYRPLIRADPQHRVARNAWLVLYVFVAIQMAWVLRPFVGNPEQPTRFFREGAWSNAYVEVARLVWAALRP